MSPPMDGESEKRPRTVRPKTKYRSKGKQNGNTQLKKKRFNEGGEGNHKRQKMFLFSHFRRPSRTSPIEPPAGSLEKHMFALRENHDARVVRGRISGHRKNGFLTFTVRGRNSGRRQNLMNPINRHLSLTPQRPHSEF